MSREARDHGGGIDAAIARFGGARAEWLDLSTGINPRPYPVTMLPEDCWRTLPDAGAFAALETAARAFWGVPEGAGAVAAGGASALIAAIPRLAPPARVAIPGPTYNEHAAAFRAAGWVVTAEGGAEARVAVHPNNPDGRLWPGGPPPAPLTVIDESFCDTCPEESLIALAARPGVLVLKSFGKFWGLAGARLGMAFGDPALIEGLRDLLGPWQVSGPALALGRAALEDGAWAAATRARLARDAERLDTLMTARGAEVVGGTTLFRTYRLPEAEAIHLRLARAHIWTRVFPYAPDWMRLGLPDGAGWDRLEVAL